MAPYPSVIPLLPILLTTKIGDTVLDIYNGTSTTTAVALQLGRKVIGYDTDTVSHEFAEKRLRMVEENLPTNQEVLDFENEFIKNNEEQDKMAA
jgi:DNA modification methylase